MLKNTINQYGYLSIVLHWFMALSFVAMYGLGWYMVDLDYYDSLYHQAPYWHKSIGIILVSLMVLRFIWNRSQPRPQELGKNPVLNKVARGVHHLFYLLVILLFISGYLISTAKGKGIEVFEWFSLPAVLPENPERGDLAGLIHELLAHFFIILALAHAVAALQHHFVHKDKTLARMLRVKTNGGKP